MKLYEINYEINEAVSRLLESVDEETGEVNADALEALEGLKIAKEEKVENIGCYIKNIDSDVEALETEIQKLQKRLKTKKNERERLVNYLVSNLETNEKYTFPRVVVSFRRSQRLEILNESAIPKKWLKIKTSPDISAIKQEIKSGKNVKGCAIVENYSLQIK